MQLCLTHVDKMQKKMNTNITDKRQQYTQNRKKQYTYIQQRMTRQVHSVHTVRPFSRPFIRSRWVMPKIH